MSSPSKIVILALLFCGLYTATILAESQAPNQQPNRPAHLKPIPPDKLKDDLDFLFRTIEEAHPNMYAYTDREEYALVKNELYKQIDHAMTTSEFYVHIQPVVYYLKDDHTLIFRPPNFIRPKITESMRKFGERLKQLVRDVKDANTNARHIPAPRKKEYAGPYSYHVFPKYDTCLMVINSFGRPDQVRQYSKKSQETFKVIREKGIANLIIDVRENRGGCGLAGDELLKYLANKPFRQIRKIEQKIVPAFFELCEQYGLDVNKTMSDEYGIDLENLKSNGNYKPGIIVTGQGQFKNPHKPSDRFQGTIYLLIAKPTFSAASNFAAAVKCFEIGTLIGQETSGKKDHYGQVLPIHLPNSGLRGQVSTAHFLTVCSQNQGGGVKPGYELKQKPQDTAKGIDTVLQFTLNLIEDSKSN